MTIAVLWVGCSALPRSGTTGNRSELVVAQKYFDAGELFRARKTVEKFLKKRPVDASAQTLMAQIIDREIVRRKELFDQKTLEEFTPDEKAEEIRTWLERAQALLTVHQYDEAVLAAEKVFLIAPENQEASRLMDEINRRARKEGVKEMRVADEAREGEIQSRLAHYRRQAKKWMGEGKWGAARLAVEKILLLAPEDREALALHQRIRDQQKLEPAT